MCISTLYWALIRNGGFVGGSLNIEIEIVFTDHIFYIVQSDQTKYIVNLIVPCCICLYLHANVKMTDMLFVISLLNILKVDIFPNLNLILRKKNIFILIVSVIIDWWFPNFKLVKPVNRQALKVSYFWDFFSFSFHKWLKC